MSMIMTNFNDYDNDSSDSVIVHWNFSLVHFTFSEKKFYIFNLETLIYNVIVHDGFNLDNLW
jgi:hypothetical protein